MLRVRSSMLALCLLTASGCALEATSPAGAGTLRAEVVAHAPLALSGTFRVAPLRGTPSFVRCGTRAGEAAWTSWISPDGRRVAARTNAGTVRLIETDGWTEVAELASPLGRIEAVAFSPDGDALATTSQSAGQLTIWSARDGTSTRAYDLRPPSLDLTFFGDLTFSPDGRRVVSPLQTVTDLSTGETRDLRDGRDASAQPDDAHDTPGPMQWVEGGEHVLFYREYGSHAASVEAELGWMQLATGARTLVLDAQPAHSHATFALSADGRSVAVSTLYAGLALHALGKATATYAADKTHVTVLAFSADGLELYVRAGATLDVMDARTLVRRRSLPWPTGTWFVARAPDGALVVSSQTESTWLNPQTGARMRTLPVPLDRAHWSADGARGVGESDAARLVAWSEADARVLRLVPHQIAPLPTLAWDGRRVPLTNEFSVALRAVSAGHFSAADWFRVQALDRATGALLLALPTTDTPRAELEADGARLLTLEGDRSRTLSSGPYVAVWCRDR